MSFTKPVGPDLILLGVTFLAGLGWIFSKEALAGWPPMLFIGCRFALAGGILLLAGRRYRKPLVRRDWRRIGVVGGLMALAMSCWVLGLSHATQLGVGAFLASLGVLLVPVFSWLLFRQRSPLSIWLALLLALAGVVLLTGNQSMAVEPAHLWFLLSACLFALLFNLNSRYAASLPVLQLVGIQLLLVGAVNLLLSALLEPWPARIPASLWGWFAASVLVATSLRFLLQIYAQGQTTAARAALIMMLEPVWTALMAALWYGETMSSRQLLGCALIFLALLLNRRRQLAAVLRR